MARSLADFEQAYADRREAMARAFLTGAYTMVDIADHFGVHYSTVSRAVRSHGGDAVRSGPRSSRVHTHFMLAEQAIVDAAKRVAAAASSPARVIVFGSYARGDAGEHSDLDLLVVEHEVRNKADEYLRLHRAVGSIGVGVDVVVLSREEFARRSQVPGTLPYWANKEGRVLHDTGA